MLGVLRFAALAIALAALTMAPHESRAAAPDAVVTEVRTSGSAGSYTFDVTIKSNDTGCAHYADWWEVVDENGGLVYRRVLLHDHADEQPFTRDGGPANLKPDQVVTVRAHVNTSGYSSAAMRGSAQAGFHAVELPAGYASALAKKPPLPEVC